MANLLLVEDDPRIGSLVSESLHEHGHTVRWGRSGAEALQEVAGGSRLDLILLDLGLPDADGVQLCRRLRRHQPDAVIVMLTARGSDMDVITGLESGADDYLTKPFSMTVLKARVDAHLRRRDAHSGDDEVLRCGDLTVDCGARRVLLGGTEFSLRAKQFDLLARLARSLGTTVSRETLLREVWDEEWFGSTKTLDVHIATLRQRLAEVADGLPGAVHPPQIATERGVGYRLDPS